MADFVELLFCAADSADRENPAWFRIAMGAIVACAVVGGIVWYFG